MQRTSGGGLTALGAWIAFVIDALLQGIERFGAVKAWGIAALVVGLCHVTTLTTSPVVWQDEVQILEYGQRFLSIPREGDLAWVKGSSEGPPTVGYLGPMVTALAMHMVGPTPVAPRLAALLAAILASGVLLGWLRRRGVRDGFAVLLSIAVLLYPPFVQSYRGARVDSTALAVIFGACWALRAGVASRRAGLVALSGALAASSPFWWPTGAMAVPVVLAEGYLSGRDQGWKSAEWLRGVVGFGLGGAAGLALGLMGLFQLQPDFLAETSAFSAQLAPGEQPLGKLLGVLAVAGIDGLCFWILVVLSVGRISPVPLLVFVLSWAAVFGTYVYSFRIAYAFPAALLVVAELCTAQPRRFPRLLPALVLGTALVGAVISLAARNGLALATAARRDPAIVRRAADIIGPGKHAVYTEPFEFYYVGHQLGWRMYRTYLELPPSQQAELLADMDYAIVTEPRLSDFQTKYPSFELVRVSDPIPDGLVNIGSKLSRYAILRQSSQP